MIGIVDYGVGNTLAFFNMYNRMNIDCKIASTADDLNQVDHIILPGVGSFDFAMSRLNASGLRESLQEMVVECGKPVLGVCVGMQMLATCSDEGQLEGLNWIPGSVRRLAQKNDTTTVPLPHMGWDSVSISRSTPLLDQTEKDAWFYYLHSYYFECDDPVDEIASCDYGQTFSCAVNREHIFGVQFHPEKSHDYGSFLLRRFSEV